MRMRIGTAAVVLVIGTAAWALAQREERPTFPGIRRPPASPWRRRRSRRRCPGLALRPRAPDSPRDPDGPTHADPDEAAASFLMKAKAEIERLEREKKAAEEEMARAKAKIQAAEAGIARWRRWPGRYRARSASRGRPRPPPCPTSPCRWGRPP